MITSCSFASWWWREMSFSLTEIFFYFLRQWCWIVLILGIDVHWIDFCWACRRRLRRRSTGLADDGWFGDWILIFHLREGWRRISRSTSISKIVLKNETKDDIHRSLSQNKTPVERRRDRRTTRNVRFSFVDRRRPMTIEPFFSVHHSIEEPFLKIFFGPHPSHWSLRSSWRKTDFGSAPRNGTLRLSIGLTILFLCQWTNRPLIHVNLTFLRSLIAGVLFLLGVSISDRFISFLLLLILLLLLFFSFPFSLLFSSLVSFRFSPSLSLSMFIPSFSSSFH